ncbi:MAG: serine hydrolase domain-containing protein [Congregibacter sp.]
MRRVSRVLAILFLLGLLPLVFLAPDALLVAAGYGAKQLCSGVFVAGLPQSFVVQRDIRPRLSLLGPALAALDLSIDRRTASAEASLLGVSARASYREGRGCALFADSQYEGQDEYRFSPAPTVQKDFELAPADSDLRLAIDEAFREPPDAGRNTLALLVSEQGQLMAERYAEPISASNPLQGWSMNKSLVATWVGMQAERGALDPNWPLRESDEVTEFAQLDSELNLLHLLQMESGLGFREFYGPGADVTRMLYKESAMWKVPATSGTDFAPGESFSYSSGDAVLASFVWQRSLELPYEVWIRRAFSEPLGISSLVAEADASGVQVGSSYAYMTGRDWLRVGQLWLDAWHGRSELLAQSWLRDSVQPRPSDALGRYGRGFWLNTGGVAFSGLPESLFYASGSAGQLVIVIPEWEMVVVRLGLTTVMTNTGVHSFLQALAKRR